MCEHKDEIPPKWLRNLLIGFISISLLLILASIGFYFYIFGSFEFTEDHEVWSQFGDYLGGTLSPILAIISICISIFIAFAIQKISSDNSSKEIQTQKRITMLTLRNSELASFRRDSDNAFNNYMNHGNMNQVVVPHANINQQNLISLIKHCISVCDNFTNRTHFLFELTQNNHLNTLKNYLNNALVNANTQNYLNMYSDMSQANAARSVLIDELTEYTITNLNQQ